ncbi:nucleoside hydrolase [Phragmitibacter flavus]|uniref:Nucleoside hydrolase n=1 Tax=Phragmitibacter flavus TaxID=2576071 RepID=A0A5R8KDN5_9BACT|nr:nucleoside hydrolase [Phragmitibacter flavus]TLD70414.1 nucleoside hydrolase [Phragmitibacter flavus]
MKIPLLAFALLLPFLAAATLVHAQPVSIIFDTDMGNDVDDALALGMIHTLEKRGACKLLAVTITKDNPKAAAFTDVINTFYGKPNLPIGIVRDGMTKEDGKFNILADQPDKYPHDLKSTGPIPDALTVLRQTLAAQPDRSVVIVQVGFFTNLARLLDTPPDEHSPLNGRDLIQQKVKLLSLMAGSFQTIDYNNAYSEYNVRIDIPSAQKLATQWPTPMLWSGYEIGRAAAYPHQSIERDYNYVPHHPLKDAYYLYNPPPHDRPTWDLTSVLAVVHPDRNYFTRSPKGTVVIDDDGFTRFVRPKKDEKTGLSQFLIMDPLQAERVREACVQLSSEPPAELKQP